MTEAEKKLVRALMKLEYEEVKLLMRSDDNYSHAILLSWDDAEFSTWTVDFLSRLGDEIVDRNLKEKELKDAGSKS
jgi:hypothetical protein